MTKLSLIGQVKLLLWKNYIIKKRHWTTTLSEILFGIKIKGFFAGPSLALTTSIFYGVWSYTGYYAIILLAGLSIIPSDLYEAAKAEGASRWQTFTKITIPLLMPIIFFLCPKNLLLFQKPTSQTILLRQQLFLNNHLLRE